MTTAHKPEVHMAEEVKVEELDKPSFMAIFKSLEDGVLEADLTSDMVDLIHDMRAHASATGSKPKAKIALTLEIRLDGGVFEIVPGYKISPPKRPRSRSIFFPTRDGGLSTSNQAQHSLPLGPGKDVTGGGPKRVA